jgi:hypothetical protein
VALGGSRRLLVEERNALLREVSSDVRKRGRIVKRVYLLILAAVAALLAVGGSTALAGKPGPNPCATGTLTSGAYDGFTVSGFCKVGSNAQVTINGNLTLAGDAVFQGMFIPANLHVTGNVKVGQGAILGLGYGTTAVVDGNVDANKPLSLYLGGIAVHGNVISNGGGTPTSSTTSRSRETRSTGT